MNQREDRMRNGNTNHSRRHGIAMLLVLLALPAGVPAAAPAPELAGEWQGKLAVDANTALTVRFRFTKGANGSYTAVLNSPDNPAVKDTPVSAVTWDGTNLKFSVPSLSGAYAGKLASGKLTGQWTQPGAAMPLELAPYQKTVLSADAARPYVGAWNGKLSLAGNTQTFVFQLKQGAGGLEGTFSIPDQGANNLPIANVTVEGGELLIRVGQPNIEYRGRLTGDRIAGKLKAPSPLIPPDGIAMELQRGEYKATPVALKLDATSFAALKGNWKGTITTTNPQNGQKVNLPITVRFETNDRNQYFGYLDSPAQGLAGIIVSDAALAAGGKFTARVGVLQAEYGGTIAGNKITGEWSQGGQRLPLELTRAP